MRPVQNDVVIWPGHKFTQGFRLQAGGGPFLTNGFRFSFSLKDQSNADLLRRTSPGSGIVVSPDGLVMVEIPGRMTARVPLGQYTYRLTGVDPSGEAFPVAWGNVQVRVWE